MPLNNFFCIEGLDGSGKTTLLEVLQEYLPPIQVGCEPTHHGKGLEVRQLLASDSALEKTKNKKKILSLLLQDREENQAWIQQKISKGFCVILDRYILSTLAYQGLHFPIRSLFEQNKHFFKPQITFFISCPLDVLSQRCQQRRQASQKKEFYEQDDLRKKIHQNYLEGIEILKQNGYPVIFLDGLKPIQEVAQDIIFHLKNTQEITC